MDLLTCSLGQTALALLPDQVTGVRQWEGAQVSFRLPLARALGLERDPVPCVRELLCRSAGGEVAFGIPSSLTQQRAAPGTIVAPPRVLRRLGAPSWLAGFFLSPGGLALIVDLALLSLAAPPLQQDSTR